MSSIYNWSKKELLLITVFLLSGSYLMMPFLFNVPISLDEGAVLNGALRIYQGQHLYQDFPSNIGPLTLYLYAGLFTIAGASYLSATVLTFLLLVFSLFFGYVLAYKLSGNDFIFASILTITWVAILNIGTPLINHNTLVIFPLIIALYLLHWRHSIPYSHTLMGILIGVATGFLLPRGLAGVLAINLILFIQSKYRLSKELLYFNIGYLLSYGSILILFSFEPILNLVNKKSAYLSSNFNLSFFLLNISVILTLTLIFLISRYFKKGTKVQQNNIRDFYIISIALLTSIFSLPDIFHIASVSFPILIFLFLVINQAHYSKYIFATIFICMCLFGFLIATLKLKTTLGYNNHYLNEFNKNDVIVYPFGELIYFLLKTDKHRPVSLPEFYVSNDPYYSIQLNEAVSAPPEYIWEQSQMLEKYKLEDLYEKLKEDCYTIYAQNESNLIYKRNMECE